MNNEEREILQTIKLSLPIEIDIEEICYSNDWHPTQEEIDDAIKEFKENIAHELIMELVHGCDEYQTFAHDTIRYKVKLIKSK